MFICIEGIDASGKETQSKLLAEYLSAEVFSFPDYNTKMGVIIKAHLCGSWKAEYDLVPNIDAHVFQGLMMANALERAGDIAALIKDGRNVIADRYWPSAVVYGGNDGIHPPYLQEIYYKSVMPRPSLYLLLDIEPEQSYQRRPERGDRYEKDPDLMPKVAKRYRELWSKMDVTQRMKTESPKPREEWVVVDARSDDIDSLAYTLKHIVDGVKERQ